MSMTLALELDDDSYALARQQAEARRTNVEEVVTHFLRVMAANRLKSLAGATPVADALRGCLPAVPEDDGRDWIEEALRRKYGDA